MLRIVGAERTAAAFTIHVLKEEYGVKKSCCALLAVLLCLAWTAAWAQTYTVEMIKEQGPAKLAEEKVELTFFAGSDVRMRDVIETSLLTEWLEQRTNVHINWEIPSTAELGTSLNLSLASGGYPDVYYGVRLSAPEILTYAAQGILVPINAHMADKAPNYTKLLAENEAVAKTVTAPGGNIYSFPRTDGGLHVPTWRKMFVYKPWLEAYMEKTGNGIPETTQDFKDMLMFFRDEDMNGNGDLTDEIPLMGRADSTPVDYLMTSFQLKPYFSPLDIKGGTVFAPFITEQWREGLTYIKDLYDEGLLARDTFVQDGNQLKELTSQPDHMIVGTVSIWGSSEVGNAAAWTSPTMYEMWTSIPPLEGPSGLRQAVNTDFSVVNDAYITSVCEHVDVAVAWLDYWLGEEGAKINYLGFENIGYTWVDEVSYNGTKPAVVVDGAIKQQTAWDSTGVRLQTPQLRYSLVADVTAAEYSSKIESEKYLPYLVEEYIPNVVWMDEAQANEVSMIESLIKPFIEEMTTKFIVGDKDLVADWDSYLRELEAMELSRWIALYQEIMDAMK